MEGDSEFPVWALLPKKETGVTSFLSQNPEYDGRGIVIAIFDSGVDPGAAGLQVTSDRKPKVIGRYDCTGAGDVDTSQVVKADSEGFITVASGRRLKVPAKWSNLKGEYHVGLKNYVKLCPKPLRERIEHERREKEWDPAIKEGLASANKSLTLVKESTESSKEIPLGLKLEKEDLENQVEMLNLLDKKYSCNGPVLDCIVFHDGNMWQACLICVDETDLSNAPLLGEYEKTHQFSGILPGDYLNVSINVYEDGNLLELVSLSSSHGTHVASIAAAHFPDEPEKNGVAPGAQIVSLSIGDSRIDTMETGTGIVRAMIRVMESQKTENPIRVINMSYGEHAHWSNSGRIGTLMNEVIDKYGVVWVTAAGNHGPALSTIGCPPDISTNNIIGVGAYVSPAMMTAQYSLRGKTAGQTYTWTSRGPTADGGKGVSVCAPGGAITSVPQYTLRSAQLLNGTSMASPHVAGAVAVLLSGMKARGLPWTPYVVHRALQNTAQYQPHCDEFAQGYGLLQVEKAFENLVAYCQKPDAKVRLQVACGGNKSKGIHLRTGPLDKPKEVAVSIEPVFADNSNIDSKEKLSFSMHVSLACEEAWVHHPAHVNLMNIPRTIQVRVDPTGLSPGAHNTCIRGYDVSCPEKGPVFRIEVTVVKPHIFPSPIVKPLLKFKKVHIRPGQINRQFVLVPDTVSFATMKLRVLDLEHTGNFVFHCMQLKPKNACRVLEYHKMVTVNPNAEVSTSFPVKGGLVLEFVIAKFWTEQWESYVDYSIQFSGCKPSVEEITMFHGKGVLSIDVMGSITAEEISPSISFKHNTITLKPTESKIVVLGSRDIIPPSRHIYQLELTYTFHLHKATEVQPESGMMSELLYESEYESQMWMLYDSNKQLIACGDAYPNKYNVKVEKGDYTIRQAVRHEKRELLEKLQDMPMLVHQKLPSPITLDVFSSHGAAITGSKKISLAAIPPGNYVFPVYIAPLHNEKHLKSISVGQFLNGALTLCKGEQGKKIDSYSFRYVLSEMTKKNTPSSKPEKSKWEEYQDAIKDLKTSWLAKMEKEDEAKKLYEEIKKEFPNHLGSYTSLLASLEPDSKRYYPGDAKASTDEAIDMTKMVFQLAGSLISAVDQPQLLQYFAIKTDHRPDAATIKADMEKQKTALIDGIVRRGAAACRLLLLRPKVAESEGINTQLIDDLWVSLHQFTDSSDIKSIGMFAAWHAAAHEHYGRLLKALVKLSEEKASRELDDASVAAMNALGWTVPAKMIAQATLNRFPPSYQPF